MTGACEQYLCEFQLLSVLGFALASLETHGSPAGPKDSKTQADVAIKEYRT